jgi:hypothetical protein
VPLVLTVVAIVAGVAVAVGVWAAVVGAHPIFTELALSGLIPGVVAGLLGGLVVAMIAPRHKVVVATIAGSLVAAVLLQHLLRHGLSHGAKNPLLWYWPIWLIPSFAVGGFLSRRLLSPNKSLERTRDR